MCSMNSSGNVSKFPIVDDLSLMDLSLETNQPQLELQETCPSENKMTHCKECGKSFVNEENMKSHMEKEHVKTKEENGKMIPNEKSEPTKTEVKVDQFPCSNCNFIGKNATESAEHAGTHLSKALPVYNCGKCEDKFNSFDDLSKHIDDVHPEIISLQSCDQCDFTSEDPNELNVHVVNGVHSVKDRTFQEIKEELYICVDVVREGFKKKLLFPWNFPAGGPPPPPPAPLPWKIINLFPTSFHFLVLWSIALKHILYDTSNS